MPLPNFIIFGTRKAGTTSLYHYLSQHPEIYMSSLKGSRFFLYDPEHPERRPNVPVKTLDEYDAFFSGAVKKGAKAIGEASPTYISSAGAARRIKSTLPDVKLIASLRHPVDRTYSHYQMAMRYRSKRDRIPFTADNIQQWAEAGLYSRYLKHYFELFDPDQIKIVILEEWKKDTPGMLEDLYRYLGVDDSFVPDMKTKYNTGGEPRNALLGSVLRPRQFHIKLKPLIPEPVRAIANRLRNLNMKKAPPLDVGLRDELQAFFRDDILTMQDMLGRDLSIWLNNDSQSASH
jgi:hypothetical protein